MSNRVKQRHSEARFETLTPLPESPATAPPFSFSTTIHRYAETDCDFVHRRRRVTVHLEGVRYYGYRYYNPDLGRWINRDPIGEESVLRRILKNKSVEKRKELSRRAREPIYLFVHNNPFFLTDYIGMISQKSKERSCISCACCSVSPLHCPAKLVKLYSVVKGSIKDANDRFKGKGSEPERNAYRHCIGACRSLRGVGPSCAIGAQYCHEKYIGGPPNDVAADKHNNKTGNKLALKFWKSCAQNCMNAMKKGKLDCKGRPCDPKKAAF